MEKLAAFFITFCLLLVAPHAGARPITDQDLVKVFSREAGTDLWREGSGLLVAGKKEMLMVTSFHVAYSSSEKKFESYILRNGKKLPIEWVASEWALGLALFRVGELPRDGFLKVAELTETESAGVVVRGVGFPYGQNEIYDVEGRSNGWVKSSLFYGLPELLEAEGLESELGMSGGALLSENGDFLGILSHQKLGESGVRTFSIPAAPARKWLEEVETGKFKPAFITEAHNLDGVNLIVRGSGWSLIAEPGLRGAGVQILLRPGPVRPDLAEIPKMAKIGAELLREGRRMKESISPDESPFLLNSLFLFVGFRRSGGMPGPNRIDLAENGVIFLRRFLQSEEQAFFVNSGLISNFLEGKWVDLFRGWEGDKAFYRKMLGGSIHYAFDRLAEYERERYGNLYGLSCFPGVFTPEEIEHMLFSPELMKSWEELKARAPSYYDGYYLPARRMVELLRRSQYIAR